ncbi:hypothetical protein EYF80_033671 [Liparis tanakae]|uniref:Uncharacterized protein n=1 Tax=Liparis tanakae TaxID=230148 RepID=A0A4Z2GS42_9TELE|nr:hypothetical protein EYF80_033671 [Liparis tanakae]
MHFLTRSSQPGRPVARKALVSMEMIFPGGEHTHAQTPTVSLHRRMGRGWDTVKHCMISYCCRASGFSESNSSGGLFSMRQLKVWLFLRLGSCGHCTPFTGREGRQNARV